MSSRTDPPCIDLRTLPGRFRCWNEIEGRKAYAPDNPWDLVIRGRSGFVAPHGGENLVACTGSTIAGNRLLEALPNATVTQDGTDGKNILFHASHLAVVGKIMRLYKKPPEISEEQREILRQRAAAHGFRQTP